VKVKIAPPVGGEEPAAVAVGTGAGSSPAADESAAERIEMAEACVVVESKVFPDGVLLSPGAPPCAGLLD
jgi:hypothetical protein